MKLVDCGCILNSYLFFLSGRIIYYKNQSEFIEEPLSEFLEKQMSKKGK